MNAFQFNKSNPIRIAIIGCGKISAKHLAAIKEYAADLKLVGFVENNTERLKEMEAQLNICGYQNISELVEFSKPDVAVLCTPSGLHAQQTIELANFGKHVIVEKPMAVCIDDATAMINACEFNNVYLFVVKQVRHNPALRLLKQALLSKRFGKIYFVNINVFWARPQSYYDEAEWRGTKKMDGGAFMNQAIHYIDLLIWLFGPVQNVQAIMGTLGRNIEVEDTGTLNLRWPSGMMGSMNVSMLTYPDNFETSITVLGEYGTVKIGGVSADKILEWSFADQNNDEAMTNEINQQIPAMIKSGHTHFYKNIIETLRGRAAPESDGREGIKSLKLLAAAYQSAADHFVEIDI